MNVPLTLHLVASHAERCLLIPICSEFTLELFFEQMFWSLALPSAVALHLPSLGSFSPLSLIRWAAGLDVNDYRLQLCLLEGLVGNHRRTKLLNLPIAIGNIAWKEAGNEASIIIIILPTTLMRNLYILQGLSLSPPGTLQGPVEDTTLCTNIWECGSEPDLWLTKEKYLKILLRRMKGKIKRSQPFVIF